MEFYQLSREEQLEALIKHIVPVIAEVFIDEVTSESCGGTVQLDIHQSALLNEVLAK